MYSVHCSQYSTLCPRMYVTGIASVISRDPPCRDGNARFTTKTLNLIKKVEDTVVQTRKVFISVSFSIASNNRNAQVTFRWETANKKNSLRNNNIDI